ncbi:MAG: GTP-binding protein [Verrucomicrobia bacterium]|nr:GTP-binding protein [Verrucomicrobiota bacterium]|tara:strand:+ start:13948 stop:14952 length:1005 start_codon:yes stop_codon:yes gene_type:complete
MNSLPQNIRTLQTRKPLVVITGFLGAGKTTFLRGLLEATAPYQIKADVILNDYENAYLDSETLRATAASVEPIAASCACCEGMDFLIDLSVSAASSRNELLFIELNGTADPIPLLESFTLLESKLLRAPRWHVCILDARHLGKNTSHRRLRELQLETASHFALSHSETLTSLERSTLYERIRAINPLASETTPELLAAALASLSNRMTWSKPASSRQHGEFLFPKEKNHHTHLAHSFTGCQILLPDVLSRSVMWEWLAALPECVIRAKALVSTPDEPGIRRLFERVGNELMADPLEVPISPRVPSSAILIGPDLDPEEILASAHRILGETCTCP